MKSFLHYRYFIILLGWAWGIGIGMGFSNPFSCFGQSPVFFSLGEESLGDLEVYSLLQGRQGSLYAATNQGLYTYYHGEFHPVPGSPEQVGRSLFNLCQGWNGRIFCHNLAGQIFELVDGKLVLFHTLDTQKLSPNCVLKALPDGSLIAVTREAVLIDSLGKAHHLLNTDTLPSGEPFLISGMGVNAAGEVAISTLPFNGMFMGHPGQLSYHPFEQSILFNRPTQQIIVPTQLNGKWFGLDENGNFYHYGSPLSPGNYQPSLMQRFFTDNHGQIWAMQHDQGLRKISLHEGRLVVSATYFDNYFISAMCQGDGGSLILGTFGDGILVIPNPKVLQWTSLGARNRISGVCSNGRDTLFALSKSGGIMSYSHDHWDTLCRLPRQSLERLIRIDGWGKGLCKSAPDLLMDGSLPVSSIKDVVKWKNGGIISASAFGLDFIGIPAPTASPLFRKRTLALASIPNLDLYFFASTTQLWKGTGSGNLDEVLYQGQSIRATSLSSDGERLFIGTNGDGVLVWDRDQIEPIFTVEGMQPCPSINRMLVSEGVLYVAHQSGFAFMHLDTREVRHLKTGDGLPQGAVKDFALLGKDVWLVTHHGLFQLSLPTQQSNTFRHWWSLDSVCAGSFCQIPDPHSSLPLEWSYWQNDLEVHFSFRGIIPAKDAHIAYRMGDSEDDWQYLSADAHQVQFRALTHGRYTLQFRVWVPGQVPETYSLQWVIHPPFWRTWWFQGLSLILFLAIISWIYLFRLRQIRKRNDAEMTRKELEKSILESKLKAIRSQMNPHFIFNSLNSIQDLILQEDTDNAYDYVVYFADLVRSTLQFSEKELIPLSEEVEFLEVYLQLEKLRFKDEFDFAVQVAGDSDILIPSLMVQPFVENALQHGLLHKKGPKHLTISFQVGDLLEISITDNGIGREASQKIKERQGGGHPSFSLSAIQQRMEILTDMAGIHAHYSFEDLLENGMAAGTRAIIRVSYRKIF